MAYNKQTWKDEIPDLTKPIKDASGKQKTDPQTGRPLYELVQEGTRITSARLNHAEQGIEDAHILIEQLAKEWGGSFVAAPNGTTGFQFTASGLTASWTAGVGYVAGRRFDVAAGSLTLNPTQGQYIYLDTDGVVKRTTSQATANAGLLLWYFATDASQVITSTDRRRTITPDTFAKKEEVVLKEPGKGLSTNNYSNEEKAKVQEHGERLQDHDQRLTVIEDEMGEAAPIPATLKPGIQTITADRTTPFNVSSIKGRTLINLLGRDGNCEDATKFNAHQATVSTDASNYVLGAKSLKVTIASSTLGTGFLPNRAKLQNGKRYLVAGYIKNGNATSANLGISNVGGTSTNDVSNNTEFVFSYKKIIATADSDTHFDCVVKGAVGQYAYFDALRLYEITAAEYAALDSMTPEQIAAKYPYVDDVKPVRNPYAIRYGKNLLPPFTEWSIYDSSITVKSPYSIEINKEKSGINSNESFAEIKYWAKVQPNTTYTITFNGTANFWVGDNDSNKNRINTPFVGDKPAGVYVFTTKSNTGYLEVVINQNERSAVGSAPYIANNPMLNIGDIALPFEPQNNDYVFYDVSLHSNVDGTVRDELFYRDGQPRKLERFREVVLDGNFISKLTLIAVASPSGYKSIRWNVNGLINTASRTALNMCTKYDGTILKPWQSNEVPDEIWVNDSNTEFYLTVPNKDSGWGDKYTPSAAEIQAYFNGWMMYQQENPVQPYNGTGTRSWAKIDSKTGTFIEGSGTATLPTQSHEYWHTPYRLIYQLAQPFEVPVTSEGKITLHEGTNVLEVGTGIVIREKTTPVTRSAGDYYSINSISGYNAANPLTWATSKILEVQRNDKKDTNWQMSTGLANAWNGTGYAVIPTANYDLTAAYSVTYLVLDRYAFTAPLIDLQGEYRTKLAAVVAEMAQDAADLETRVSVVETQYARKQQGQWIPLVLIGGATIPSVPYGSPQFMKDEFGFVHLKGVIRCTGLGLASLKLPKGCYPLQGMRFAVGNGNTGACLFDILADGTGNLAVGNINENVHLSGISFRAEK